MNIQDITIIASLATLAAFAVSVLALTVSAGVYLWQERQKIIDKRYKKYMNLVNIITKDDNGPTKIVAWKEITRKEYSYYDDSTQRLLARQTALREKPEDKEYWTTTLKTEMDNASRILSLRIEKNKH